LLFPDREHPVRLSGTLYRFSNGMTRVCLRRDRTVAAKPQSRPGIAGIPADHLGQTAALFALASYAGAILAGEPESSARQHGRFGFLFGMLFQVNGRLSRLRG
jgi:hypothetical protein